MGFKGGVESGKEGGGEGLSSAVIRTRERATDGSRREGSLNGEDGSPKTCSEDEATNDDHSDGVGEEEL